MDYENKTAEAMTVRLRGGHWKKLSTQLEERAQYAGSVWELLAQIEQALDTGICGGGCYRCAQRRVILALEAYFDTMATDIARATEVLKHFTPLCELCQRSMVLETPGD